MPERFLPGLGLTGFWDLGAEYKDGMDENLRRLSTLVQAGAISQTTALPGSPSVGDIYIVPATASANPNHIAVFDGPAGSEEWVYLAPGEGWRVYIQDQSVDMRFNGTAWAVVLEGGSGSGSGSGSFGGLTDTNFDPALVSPDLVGRPVGVVSTSPEVKLGVLAALQSMPIPGGYKILASVDFSATPLPKVVVADTHLYDEVHFYWLGVDSDDTLAAGIFPDGVNAASFSYSRGRINGSPDVTYAHTNEVGVSTAFIASATSGVDGKMILRGLKAGLPLVSDKVAYASGYFHHEFGNFTSTVEVRGLSFDSVSGNITSGFFFAVGVQQSAQPVIASFDQTSAPADSAVRARFTLPINTTLRGGAQGTFRVGSNPTSETVVQIRRNGTQIGTVTVPTSGAPVVAISSEVEMDSGDVLDLFTSASSDYEDLHGALILEGRA